MTPLESKSPACRSSSSIENVKVGDTAVTPSRMYRFDGDSSIPNSASFATISQASATEPSRFVTPLAVTLLYTRATFSSLFASAYVFAIAIEASSVSATTNMSCRFAMGFSRLSSAFAEPSFAALRKSPPATTRLGKKPVLRAPATASIAAFLEFCSAVDDREASHKMPTSLPLLIAKNRFAASTIVPAVPNAACASARVATATGEPNPAVFVPAVDVPSTHNVDPVVAGGMGDRDSTVTFNPCCVVIYASCAMRLPPRYRARSRLATCGRVFPSPTPASSPCPQREGLPPLGM